MRYRRYLPADYKRVRALFDRQNYDTFFCDPDDEINPVSVVALDDSGEVVGAMIGRLVIEPFLLVDMGLPPISRWRMIRNMTVLGMHEMARLGYREALVSVPETLTKYASLLAKLPAFVEDTRRRFVVGVRAYLRAAKE